MIPFDEWKKQVAIEKFTLDYCEDKYYLKDNGHFFKITIGDKCRAFKVHLSASEKFIEHCIEQDLRDIYWEYENDELR